MVTRIPSEAAELYLDLLKKCLTRYMFPETHMPLRRPPLTIKHLAWAAYPPIAAMLKRRGIALYRETKVDEEGNVCARLSVEDDVSGLNGRNPDDGRPGQVGGFGSDEKHRNARQKEQPAGEFAPPIRSFELFNAPS